MRLLMKLYLDVAHTVIEFLFLPYILASFYQLSKNINSLDVYKRRHNWGIEGTDIIMPY